MKSIFVFITAMLVMSMFATGFALAEEVDVESVAKVGYNTGFNANANVKAMPIANVDGIKAADLREVNSDLDKNSRGTSNGITKLWIASGEGSNNDGTDFTMRLLIGQREGGGIAGKAWIKAGNEGREAYKLNWDGQYPTGADGAIKLKFDVTQDNKEAGVLEIVKIGSSNDGETWHATMTLKSNGATQVYVADLTAKNIVNKATSVNAKSATGINAKRFTVRGFFAKFFGKRNPQVTNAQ